MIYEIYIYIQIWAVSPIQYILRQKISIIVTFVFVSIIKITKVFVIVSIKLRSHIAILLQNRSKFAAKSRRTKSPGVNTTAKFAATNIH